MYVQQIEFDHAAKVCLNEGGINDVGDMSAEQLLEAAVAQFGEVTEVVYDPENESRAIGWKFQNSANYDEVPDGEESEFTLETWVILHDKLPEVKYFYSDLGEIGSVPGTGGPAIVVNEVTDNS
jgi:hypothetical protein